MNTENKYSPVIFGFSKHKNLLDLVLKNNQKNILKNMKTILKVIILKMN